MEERSTHASDEQLIAHLDGELTAAEHAEVECHLKRCWQCRARAMQLQDQVRRLSEAWANQAYLPPADIERSRQRCRRFVHGNAGRGGRGSEPRFYLLAASLRWRFAAAGLLLTAALAGWRLWTATPAETPPNPAAQLTRAALDSDAHLHQVAGAVHQVIRVEVAELRPRNRRRISRLEVWSHPPQQRAALRWSYPSSGLRYAHWRSAQGSHFYDPAVEPRPLAGRPQSGTVVFLSELTRHGMDIYRLEAAFLQWLQNKDWRAVAFSREFAEFAGRDGVRLQLRQTAETARLIAERGGRNGIATAILELDRRTNRPRFAALRFERDGQAAEFRLVMESETVVPPEWIPAAVFTPTVPEFVAKREPLRPIPLGVPPRIAPAPPLLPHPEELDLLEVEVWYLLHRIGACLGDPVTVRRTAAGIEVAGRFASESRSRQVAAALDEFAGHSWVRIDLEVAKIAEASGESAPGIVVSTRGKTPLDEYLAQRYASRQELNAFLNDVVSTSKAQLAEAWALRRVAERFSRPESLPLSRRSLLESMAEDHLNALQRHFRHLERAFELPAGEPVPVLPTPRNWREACHTPFEHAHALHRLVMAFFAGDSPVSIYGSASGDSSQAVPGQGGALEALRNALSLGESSLATARSLVHLQLAGPPAVPEANRQEGNN